jgi:hypothetical protein
MMLNHRAWREDAGRLRAEVAAADAILGTHQKVYLHPYPKELMLRNHVSIQRGSLRVRRLLNQDTGSLAWKLSSSESRLVEGIPPHQGSRWAKSQDTTVSRQEG